MTPLFPASVIEFNSALPIWLAGMMAAAAIASVINFYRGHPAVPGKGGIRLLMLLRIEAVVVAAVMLMAPTRIWTFQHHSRGRLYLVLDDTRSMSRIDPPQTKSRAALAEEALRRLRPTLDHFDITLVPLSHPQSITPSADPWFDTALDLLHAPGASATPIGESLRHIAEESQSPSTVLILSDGRQNAGALPEPVARQLAARGSRLFALSVGSPNVVRDAAVDSIDAPAFILAGDDVRISATVRLDAITDPVTAEFARDGQRIAIKSISPAPLTPVEFTDAAPPIGDHTYTISINPVPNEATTRNNQLSTKVSVRPEKIHVLLIDDEPRWEFQFLKPLLQLDRTVDLKSRLLQPARIENIPSPPPDPLPASEQAWSAFEVVIVGDVSPSTFTPAMQSELAAALGKGKPKSLILIAGPRNMPGRYAGMPLASVLPIDLTRTSSIPADTVHNFVPRFTSEAQASTLVRLVPDEPMNRAFWSSFPPFSWHDDHTTPKPAAQVLWESTTESSPQPRIPLLSQMTYGPSRILYLASPETWRLRYVQAPSGEVADLHRRFWSQALRWAFAGEAANDNASDRDVEDLNQSADPALLAALARAGNGASFDVNDAAKLTDALPTTQHVQTQTARLGFFEDPDRPSTHYLHWAAYILFVLIVSTEWVMRKRRGLV